MLYKELEPYAAKLPANVMEIVVDIKVNTSTCRPLVTPSFFLLLFPLVLSAIYFTNYPIVVNMTCHFSKQAQILSKLSMSYSCSRSWLQG